MIAKHEVQSWTEWFNILVVSLPLVLGLLIGHGTQPQEKPRCGSPEHIVAQPDVSGEEVDALMKELASDQHDGFNPYRTWSSQLRG